LVDPEIEGGDVGLLFFGVEVHEGLVLFLGQQGCRTRS
jgi:hypothetical protein